MLLKGKKKKYTLRRLCKQKVLSKIIAVILVAAISSGVFFFQIGNVSAAILFVQEANNSHTYLSPSTSIMATLSSGATGGNLLVTGIGIDKNSGTITVPTGFTLIHDYTSASVSAAMAYKISTGGETSITWSYTNNEEASMWVGEFSGLVDSDVLDVSQENNSGGTAVQSISTGTTVETSQANELAVVMAMADSGVNTETGRAWTNGFQIEDHVWSNSGTPALNVATSTLSATGIADTWGAVTVEASFAGTYTPGEYMTIRIDMVADTGDNVKVGEINMEYLVSD